MADDISGILFDFDGVLFSGGAPLPGALDTLRALQRAGTPFMILSNMTLSSRAEALGRLRQAGVDLPPQALLTPPAAAARWLRQQGGGPAALFVAPSARAEFDGLPQLPEQAERGASYVVVGDMGDDWDARQLNHALRLLLGGAQLLALGMGRYWQAPDGPRLDGGAFAQALAFASGREPLVIGKPAPEFFQLALETLGLPAGQVAMVGDDVLSDVGAAQAVGMKGILVQTGKFRPSDLERGIRPDWLLPDVGQVPALLWKGKRGVPPDG